MFLTDSRQVAIEYTRPLMGSGTKPRDANESKGLYSIRLLFNETQIFDLRIQEHKDLFLSYVHKSEGEIRKSDVMSVHSAHGSNLRGVFPSFGVVRELSQFLLEDGFQAMIVAEGSQGASLAVFNPQENLEIIKVEKLTEGRAMSKKIKIRVGELKRLIEGFINEEEISDPKPFE
jgi:hypothetical protein